ncbi:hypothetical protein AB6813_01505 [bacterium RCC_150]
MTSEMNRPEVAELVELVQSRLGTTREAAEEHVKRTILGAQAGSDPVQEALADYRAMPALVSAPTPPNFSLIRLHQTVADLEWITLSVERGQIMPTPGEIRALFGYA